MISRVLKDKILQAYFLLRLPFLYLLKFIFAAPAGNPDKASRILVMRIDRLGDFVLSMPLVDNLRRAYPEVKIEVLVRPYLAELAGMVKGIDNVIVYREKVDALRRLRTGNTTLS